MSYANLYRTAQAAYFRYTNYFWSRSEDYPHTEVAGHHVARTESYLKSLGDKRTPRCAPRRKVGQKIGKEIAYLIAYCREYSPLTHRDPQGHLSTVLGYTVPFASPLDILLQHVHRYPNLESALPAICASLVKHNFPVKVCADPRCPNLVNTKHPQAMYSHTHHGFVCTRHASQHVLTQDTEEWRDPYTDTLTPAYTHWDGDQFTNPAWFYNAQDLVFLHDRTVVYNSQVGRYVSEVTFLAGQDSGWEWRDDDDGVGLHPEGA